MSISDLAERGKPQFSLTNFSLRDPDNGDEFRTLAELDGDTKKVTGSFGKVLAFIARGIIRPIFVDDGEEDVEDSEEEDEGVPARLGAVFCTSIQANSSSVFFWS